jgi:mannonate dehydratase
VRFEFALPEQGRPAGLHSVTLSNPVLQHFHLEYSLKAAIPVAEKAGIKMALHPDDPPLSPLRGIGRILTSAANFRRVLEIVAARRTASRFARPISN